MEVCRIWGIAIVVAIDVGKLIDSGKLRQLLSKLSVFYGIIPGQVLLPEVLNENFGSGCKRYYKPQWILLACKSLVQVFQCGLERLLYHG